MSISRAVSAKLPRARSARRNDGSWRLVLLVGCLSCSRSTDGDGAGGSSSTSTVAVLDLIRQSNDLGLEVHRAYCASCPCGAFLDVSAETEECLASVIDDSPRVRSALVDALQCIIASSEDRLSCLESAGDCDQAEACGNSPNDTCDASVPGDEEFVAEFNAEVQQRCGAE